MRYEQNMTCPFCHDADFDAFGLKIHLLQGWCQVFSAIPAKEGSSTTRATDAATHSTDLEGS